MKATMHIREMQPDDSDFIRSLIPRFVEVGSPPWRDLVQMMPFHQRSAEEVIASCGSNESNESKALPVIVFIAEDEAGDRLGFIHLLDSADYFTGERQGYISALAVTREAEGKGIASKLMEVGEVWARQQGYRILALDTFGANTHARSFYQHRGYVEETVKLIKELC